MKNLSRARKPVPTCARAGAFATALALGLAVFSHSAYADSCEKLIAAINSTKATQDNSESQQKALREQIARIDKGQKAFQQKLQSGECRPEGAAEDAKGDKRPSCKMLLRVTLNAGKLRDSLKRQLDTLNKMAADSDGDQDKLVKMAKAEGCPPYGKPKSAEAEKPAPKAERKAVHHRSHRSHRHARRVRHRRQRHYRRSSGGPVVTFGGGGVGIGFRF